MSEKSPKSISSLLLKVPDRKRGLELGLGQHFLQSIFFLKIVDNFYMDYDSYRAAKSSLTVLDHELEKISYSCHCTMQKNTLG